MNFRAPIAWSREFAIVLVDTGLRFRVPTGSNGFLTSWSKEK